MKAIVINGSPHGDKGNTELILGPFLDGMRAAGAEVRVFQVKDMSVRPCSTPRGRPAASLSRKTRWPPRR
jgi:multimeric flavodoxin WrbA